MSTFDDRENRFETEFTLDESLRFKAEARRDKLVGAWAAGLLGMTGDAVDEYALSVVRADLEEPGDDDVFRKLRGDLDGASKAVTDDEIRAKMAECFQAAVQSLKAGE